jgi:hypothetical protein
MFCRLQREGPSKRNGEHDRALVRLPEEPAQHGAKIRNLLLHVDALRVVRQRVTATALFPVADQEIALEIEQPLKLADLIQQGQAWTTLHDQQRRLSFALGAETNALLRAVDVEINRAVDCGSCCRHRDYSS